MFVNFQKVKILKKSREILFVYLRLFKCDFKVHWPHLCTAPTIKIPIYAS